METKRLEEFYKIQSRFYDLTRWAFLFNREKSISMLDIKEGEKILDLACGTGLNIPHLLQKTPEDRITGIDFSDSMLDKARRKFPNVNFVQGDVSNYEFGERFDSVVCTYSMSMIERWQETIGNVRNHLSENGKFLILDFHQWNSLRPIYHIFRKWLDLHDINPEKNYVPELKKRFKKVEEHVFNLGYSAAIIARNEK